MVSVVPSHAPARSAIAALVTRAVRTVPLWLPTGRLSRRSLPLTMVAAQLAAREVHRARVHAEAAKGCAPSESAT